MAPFKTDLRHVRLFRNNSSQAVRIPAEFELPGNEATIRREGDRLIIEPIPAKSLLCLLAEWQPMDEALPDINDQPIVAKSIF